MTARDDTTRGVPTLQDGVGDVGVLQRAGYLAIAAAAVYVLSTIAGNVLDPTYSQIRQHVSDLTATGASTWPALVGHTSSTTSPLQPSPSSSIAPPHAADCGSSELGSSSSMRSQA